MDEKTAFIILNNLNGLNSKLIIELYRLLGSAKAILDLSHKRITTTLGLKEEIAYSLASWEKNVNWRQDLAYLEKEGIEVSTMFCHNYPDALFCLNDPPPVLYYKGSLATASGIGIIGRRDPSLWGKEQSFKWGEKLGSKGTFILSGLARGIDTCAHLGALNTGKTGAILGSGLSTIYPPENRELAAIISKSGFILSENPCYAPVTPKALLKRNRLLCALSFALLVVEAKTEGGSLDTAKKAKKLRVPLLTLAPPKGSNCGEGNKKIINELGALVAEKEEDLLKFSGQKLATKDLVSL